MKPTSHRPCSRSENRIALAGALLLSAAWLFTGGCATSAQTRSGFVTHYAKLKPVDGSPGLFAAEDAPFDGSRPIRVTSVAWQAEGNTTVPISADDRDTLCLFAQRALERALAKAYPNGFAGTSDKRPLELQSAITRVSTSNPALNVVTTLALFVPLNNGGVCVEWRLVDPSTQEPVAEGVAVQTGKPWQVVASFETLGHARTGLTRISTEVASYVSSGSHGAKTP